VVCGNSWAERTLIGFAGFCGTTTAGEVIATGDETGKVCVAHPKNGKVLMSVSTGDATVESVAVTGGAGTPTVIAAGNLEGKIFVFVTMPHLALSSRVNIRSCSYQYPLLFVSISAPVRLLLMGLLGGDEGFPFVCC
jgi:hypothetical protein